MDVSRPATQAAFGELVDISQQAVSDLKARGVLTDNATLLRWNHEYCAHIREQAAGRAGQIEAGLTAERARLAKEQADKIAMQNAVARRSLAPVSVIEEVLGKVGTRIAGRFDALPGALRRRLPDLPAEALRLIEETIAEARREVASMSLDDLVDVDEADDDADAEVTV